jgi:hypothetical protein
VDGPAVSDFISRAGSVERDAWDETSLRDLALVQIPSDIMGSRRWLLESDVRLTWTRWFIDGLTDRSRYIRDRSRNYAQLYSEILGALRLQHPTDPIDEVQAVAGVLSNFAWDEVSRMRQAGRRTIKQSVKEDLWFAAEPDPRCYLCGYGFSDFARDRFLGRSEKLSIGLPLLVDFTRPRGLNLRDLLIEVDHVSPVAGGGDTTYANLRLACGWCNRVKSNKRSILDAPASSSSRLVRTTIGHISVPQPLWVLRIVATRGRCEDPSGCAASLSTHELFVASRSAVGALNPANAIVACQEHDPWAASRWVSPALQRATSS